MKNWREDARPEWPAAAFGTQGLSTVAGETVAEAPATGAVAAAGTGEDGSDGAATWAFPPAPGPGTGGRPGAARPEGPRGDVRYRSAPPADGTVALPRVDPARQFPEPDVFDAGPGRPRDPWGQGGPGAAAGPYADRRENRSAAPDADPSVDPHEVTVQMDAVQLGDGLIRRAGATAPASRRRAGARARGRQDAPDGPVFVDESGRRSRLYRRIGMAVAVACAGYAVVIVATLLSGSSDAPWLPVPGQQGGQPAGQVDTSPLPEESTQPTGTGGPTEGASASPGDSTSPPPGPDAGASGVPIGPADAGTSAAPRPAQTRTAPGPGGGDAGPVPTKPTTPAATEAPDPGPEPTTEPPADPTPTDGDDAAEPAARTRAAGPAHAAPASAPSSQEQGGLPSPSPEYVL